MTNRHCTLFENIPLNDVHVPRRHLCCPEERLPASPLPATTPPPGPPSPFFRGAFSPGGDASVRAPVAPPGMHPAQSSKGPELPSRGSSPPGLCAAAGHMSARQMSSMPSIALVCVEDLGLFVACLYASDSAPLCRRRVAAAEVCVFVRRFGQEVSAHSTPGRRCECWRLGGARRGEGDEHT